MIANGDESTASQATNQHPSFPIGFTQYELEHLMLHLGGEKLQGPGLQAIQRVEHKVAKTLAYILQQKP